MAEHAPKLHQELTWIPQLSARSRRTCPTGMEGLVEASCASLQTSMRTRENSTCDHGDASRRRTDACQAAQRCTFASLFWPPSPPLAPSRFRGSGWMWLHERRAIPALLARHGTCGVEVGYGVPLGQVRDAVVAGVRLWRCQPLAGAEGRALAALLSDAPDVGERGASWRTRPPRGTPSRSPSCMAGQATE